MLRRAHVLKYLPFIRNAWHSLDIGRMSNSQPLVTYHMHRSLVTERCQMTIHFGRHLVLSTILFFFHPQFTFTEAHSKTWNEPLAALSTQLVLLVALMTMDNLLMFHIRGALFDFDYMGERCHRRIGVAGMPQPGPGERERESERGSIHIHFISC